MAGHHGCYGWIVHVHNRLLALPNQQRCEHRCGGNPEQTRWFSQSSWLYHFLSCCLHLFWMQGVWLSLRNTGLIWLVVWSFSSIAIWIYAIFKIGQVTATFHYCLFLGCVIGMLVGCGYGGLDVIYHIALRFILYWKGLAPFRT